MRGARSDEDDGAPQGAGDTAAWVADVAAASAADVGVPAALLGEYLTMLADAALTGRRPPKSELAAVRTLGQRAAEQGVDATRAVDLYLTAAWRLWHEIPAVVRTRDRDQVSTAAAAVLRVVNDAVEVLVDGHQAARQQLIRQEESLRRELIDDLLRGDADVARLVQRAEPFGLDLSSTHQVLLASSSSSRFDVEQSAPKVERVVVERFGEREVLVATKDDLLVVLVPGDPVLGPPPDNLSPAEHVHRELSRTVRAGRCRVGVGRPYPGAYGITRSYEEAREALRLAARLQLDADVVHAQDLLAYRVLSRDQDALRDLVQATLHPLDRARGGAAPLLQTLDTYFTTGAVATETARRLHVSVRTVTYRIARVKALTGHDAADPSQRLALQMAVVGARLLGWPDDPAQL